MEVPSWGVAGRAHGAMHTYGVAAHEVTSRVRVSVESGRQGTALPPREPGEAGTGDGPRDEKALWQRRFRKEAVARRASAVVFGRQRARVYAGVNVPIVQNVANCPS
ncbi:hypothetical protein GCM10010249_33620 [Streptomyces roseolilacinus]|uniref:Uncharacterized protein n=1 Tax=Streptomyces roseolilacinus TaxID=66904 RepID=A0A918B0Z6_9ACTN|nr:hypothetical protein GCM10010249_33620 [Streptomyces roseolilacinus]